MSDSAVLLAYLQENATPDGWFGQNLKTAAATIGWIPDQLSEAMQDLVADGKVEPAHEGGDPGKIAGSSWRVLDMPNAPAAAGGDPADLSELKIGDLRKLAKVRGVDIKGLKSKDQIAAKIQAAAVETTEPPADDPVDLSTLDVDALIQYAGEHDIELPAGELEQADLVEYITEAEAERAGSA